MLPMDVGDEVCRDWEGPDDATFWFRVCLPLCIDRGTIFGALLLATDHVLLEA